MSSETRTVEQTLAARDVHDQWEGRYRTPDIVRFQDEQVDFLARLIGADRGTSLLDAGCGTATNAVRLARRGVRVQAIDFSETILEQARENVRSAGVEDLVTLERGDIIALPHEPESVESILCWGVLMHVPEVERAVSELSRVLRPGGQLVVCEGNLRSLDEVALRVLDRLGRTTSVRRAPSGTERWRDTPAGPLFARRMDPHWLRAEFERHGLVLRHFLPSQLTEAYIYLPPGSAASRAVHRLNDFWFHVVGTPRFASDVFLVFERPA
jgi:2-polyprenyl-3-methyl-5-hydroxy-6-metoxy-1,4-benzoquinol methylase